MSTPVVLIVFNRPRVTARLLEALRSTAPDQIFVIADGPRAHRPDDARLCADVRRLVDESIDWPCSVQTRYAEQNLGLEANVELGLDWVFAQVDSAVVFEDDCIPDPTFLRFCDELIDRYADDRRVWMIAGDKKAIPADKFHEMSYAFTSWASVWGWATWADRWQDHRAGFPRLHEDAAERAELVPRTSPAVRTTPAPPAPGALMTVAANRHFTRVAETLNGDHYGWDHHFWVTILSRGGLCVTPSRFLVENDGFGPDATHTQAAHTPQPASPMPFPLTHPDVALNEDAERELELILLSIDGNLSRIVKRIIRPLWMRQLVGKVLRHPLIWPFAKRLVAR